MDFLLIVRQISVAADGDRVTEIRWLRQEDAIRKILCARRDFTDLPHALSSVRTEICGNADSIDAESFCDIQRAIQVVSLRNDDDLICLKDVPRAVEALVGGESRMIHENVL